MQRALASTIVVGLLIATAAAFVITERLKLEKSPVYGTRISSQLSPSCGCATRRATILFKLRKRDTVTLTVRDASRSLVATLVERAAEPRGVSVFHWDGRTGGGGVARDGTYFVEIQLARQHRTLLLPNQIMLDTTPPEVLAATASRQDFSPDGDHQSDAVGVRYTLSERAYIQVYLRGHRIVRGRFHRTDGSFTWAGKLGLRRLLPGTYVLSVGAIDLAGNRTPAARRADVRITLRYIVLANRRITGVAPGGRVVIGVSTDARRYSWSLGRRHGYAKGPLLNLPAPKHAGRYHLVVTERGHSDRALVIVG